MVDVVEIITRSLGATTISASTISLTITSIRRILKELQKGEELISKNTANKKTSPVLIALLCMLCTSLIAVASIATYFILNILFEEPKDDILNVNNTPG